MNEKLEKAMRQISVDEEMGIAQVFGVELAPAMGDPDGEWMVLPDEVSSGDNYFKANQLFSYGEFADFEEFQSFVNMLISVARGVGEEDVFLESFNRHLERVVESVEGKGEKGEKVIH